MNTPLAGFAYAQARLQARYSQRPGSAWERLAATDSLAALIQSLRDTAFGRLAGRLSGRDDAHTVESLVREHFRQLITEIARWLPREWRPAVTWLARLPELPALQALAADATAPAWLTDAAGSEKPPSWLARDLRGAAVVEAWRRRWHAQWPAMPNRWHAQLTLLEQHALAQYRRLGAGAGAVAGDEPELVLAARWGHVFRRQAPGPAAVIAFIGLAWLDHAHLRGLLVQRRLLPGRSGDV
ncbi:MAG: hypothetical protein PVI37_00870 [Gammaproteobacteria bacterium]